MILGVLLTLFLLAVCPYMYNKGMTLLKLLKLEKEELNVLEKGRRKTLGKADIINYKRAKESIKIIKDTERAKT